MGWSRWVFVVEPGRPVMPTDAEIRVNAARFCQQHFGQSCQVKVNVYADQTLAIDVLAYGVPVMDPRWVDGMVSKVQTWARGGWGESTSVSCRLATTSEARGVQ